MKFCTAINCMDGRVQLPVIEYLKRRFKVEFVDVITEPGPNLILARQGNYSRVESIFERIKISVERHHSWVSPLRAITTVREIRLQKRPRLAI